MHDIPRKYYNVYDAFSQGYALNANHASYYLLPEKPYDRLQLDAYNYVLHAPRSETDAPIYLFPYEDIKKIYEELPEDAYLSEKDEDFKGVVNDDEEEFNKLLDTRLKPGDSDTDIPSYAEEYLVQNVTHLRFSRLDLPMPFVTLSDFLTDHDTFNQHVVVAKANEKGYVVFANTTTGVTRPGSAPDGSNRSGILAIASNTSQVTEPKSANRPSTAPTRSGTGRTWKKPPDETVAVDAATTVVPVSTVALPGRRKESPPTGPPPRPPPNTPVVLRDTLTEGPLPSN